MGPLVVNDTGDEQKSAPLVPADFGAGPWPSAREGIEACVRLPFSAAGLMIRGLLVDGIERM